MTVTKWTLVRRPLGRHFVFFFQCLDREVVSYGTVRIPFFVKASELQLDLDKKCPWAVIYCTSEVVLW